MWQAGEHGPGSDSYEILINIGLHALYEPSCTLSLDLDASRHDLGRTSKALEQYFDELTTLFRSSYITNQL